MHTGARGAAPAFLTGSGGAEARASSSWGTRSRAPRHSVATPVSPADPSGPQVFVKCHFDYDPASDSLIPCKEAGLRFCAGDLLQIVNQDDPNWWQVRGFWGVPALFPPPRDPPAAEVHGGLGCSGGSLWGGGSLGAGGPMGQGPHACRAQACHVEGGSAGLVPSQLLEEKRKAFVRRDAEMTPASGTWPPHRVRGPRIGSRWRCSPGGGGTRGHLLTGRTPLSPAPRADVPIAMALPSRQVQLPRHCPRAMALSLSPSPAQQRLCPGRGPVWQPQWEEEEEDDVPDDKECWCVSPGQGDSPQVMPGVASHGMACPGVPVAPGRGDSPVPVQSSTATSC